MRMLLPLPLASQTALILLLPLTLAAPPIPPLITSLTFSGTGCPSTSSSVSTTATTLSDSAVFAFSQLSGDSTDNCAVHIVSAGGSAGWQVALREVAYKGDVELKGNSALDTVTQVFWSEKAGDTGILTGGLTCAGPAIKDYVTVKSSTVDLKWSRCTTADGSPGILNVNFRPVVQGDFGRYDFRNAGWGLEWRRC